MYGIPTGDSFSTDPNFQSNNPLAKSMISSEVLINGKVSNDSLISVWVHVSRKEGFLEELKKQGVEMINCQNLDKIVNP